MVILNSRHSINLAIITLFNYLNPVEIAAQISFKKTVLKSYKMHPSLEAELDEYGFYNITQRVQLPLGTAIFRYRASTGKIDKFYKVYNDNNEIISSIEYDTMNINDNNLSLINGICIGYLHGAKREFYANGKKLNLQEYKNGMKHGAYKYWDPDGRIVSECYYKFNKLDSCYKNYYQGTEQIRNIRWYKNGQIQYDAEFRYPNGNWQEYTRSYPKEIHKRWNPDGSYAYLSVEDSAAIRWEKGKIEFSVKKDSITGKWLRQEYWPNGNLLWKEIADNFFGDNPGIRMNYDQDGKFRSKESLSHSKESGKYKTEEENLTSDRMRAPDYWRKTILPEPRGGWNALTDKINQELAKSNIKKEERGIYTIQIEITDYPNKVKVIRIGTDKLQGEIVQKITAIIEGTSWSAATIQDKTVKSCVLSVEVEIK